MTDDSTTTLRFSIDRLVTSRQRIFGWGWVAHGARIVEDVSLCASGNGWTHEIPANFGLARWDVAEAFPGLVQAASSGFVLTGYLPEPDPDSIELLVRFADGTTERLDAATALQSHNDRYRKRRMAVWLVRAVWRRLKRLDLQGILRRARAQSYAAAAVDEQILNERLLPALQQAQGILLVFDHNMGGGANQYRRRIIAEHVADGRTVLLCTYNLPTLEYYLHLFRPGVAEEAYRSTSFMVLDAVLDHARVDELFVNSPVSFDEPLLFAEWLASVRARLPAIRLTMTVHDYFAVCPSFVLLNSDGRYCGIPSISECAACLARHRATYVALSPQTEIGPWRALWGRCLKAADEVRCFSESARGLLARAYADLDPMRITVVPHRIDFHPARTPRLDHHAPLTIGIVGQISAQKGAGIVRDLVAHIDAGAVDARVVVLGTLDLAVRSSRLRVMGTYERADLVDLIESQGINVFLFPSICPETFSYVVEELMLLEVPIVAFELGAPADRLRGYALGRLVSEVNAAAALAAIVEFHAKLAAGEQLAA